MEDKTFIHDNDLEELVLGTIMSHRNVYDDIRSILDEKCFYTDINKQIYNAIVAIDSRGDEPDIITVTAEVRKTNDKIMPYDIARIGSQSSFSAEQHARRLKDLSIRRDLYNIGHYLINNGTTEIEDIEDVVSTATDKINDLLASDATTISTFHDALRQVYENVNTNLSGEGITGFPTGFRRLDEHGGGLHKGDLIVIGAESSVGKSSLSLTICANACKAGAKVAFYSLEMEMMKLASRIISQQSGISSSKILYGRLSSEELVALDQAVGVVQNMQFFFDDRSRNSFDNIVSSIRSMKNKHDIDGVVVDYLQILPVNGGKNERDEKALADMSRRLKNIAMELGIWIVIVSQLNRDTNNPVPSMARLRGSGQIAEAADIIMLIYRPELQGASVRYPEPFENASTQGTAMIDIVKGRNIGIGRFLVGFNAPLTYFYDLDEIPNNNNNNNNDKPF
jgi:replicative DNA helicase